MAIRKAGVVGCGLMGGGIAQTCSQSGYEVVVREVNQELLNKGIARIHSAWDMMATKGKLTKLPTSSQLLLSIASRSPTANQSKLPNISEKDKEE